MRHELKKLRICPHCKGELQWEIQSADENHRIVIPSVYYAQRKIP